MPRSDGRIESGQKLTSAISARAWNRAQDAADIVLGANPQALGEQIGRLPQIANIVLIKNTSGADVPWLGVLGISGVLISPIGGTLSGTNEESKKARQFAARPTLIGVTPQMPSHKDNFVVCVEPIKNNAVGRAAISGAFACKVNVVSSAHKYATIKDGDVTQLQTAACGPVRLAWSDTNPGEDRWACGVS